MKKLLLAFLLLTFANVAHAEDSAMPKTFDFYIGGFDGPSYFLKIENGKLIYSSHGTHAESKTTTETLVITPQKWAEFKKALSEINIWNWPESCTSKVMDGTQWKVKIIYSDKAITSAGSNNYPLESGKCSDATENTVSFNKFLAALKNLTGKEIH